MKLFIYFWMGSFKLHDFLEFRRNSGILEKCMANLEMCCL